MISSQSQIAILMATYNGERFIAEQLDSILSQTSRDWHLFVHDDESQDRTGDIIRRYSEMYPEWITVLDYPSQRGALANFMSILERVDASYYMFSDQDDVWFSDKVEKSYAAIKEQESLHSGKAIIVHSDVCVTDESLNVFADSYREYGHVYPDAVTDFDSCVINVTIGCAMLFNKKAKEVSLDRSWERALMHDGWVSARTFAENGIVYAIQESLMYYRNHDSNTIGAVDGSRFTFLYRLKNLLPMLRLNIKQYQMLRSAGYGSIFKYYYNKIKLHIH